MEIRVIDTARPPYNAIGYLDMEWSTGGSYQGSGALISARHVLTCAHNLTDKKNKQPQPGQATAITFYAGWNGGPQPQNGIAAARAICPPAFVDGQDAWDIGIVELAEDVPNVARFFVPQAVINDSLVGTDLALAGYPGDHPGEMWHDVDQVAGVSRNTNAIVFTHDTYPGSSGSPLYLYDGLADVTRQYAVHNAQNQAFGLRRGLLITEKVFAWIGNTLKQGMQGAGPGQLGHSFELAAGKAA